jgi:2-polyprenyl-3-methyl-5-hydroxy-6-metoxy-1,4-benzoquinol methylase
LKLTIFGVILHSKSKGYHRDRSGAMSDEQYYDDDRIWSSGFEHSSDEIGRLSAVKGLITKEVTSILDVGCGNGHFVNSMLGVDSIDRV